MLGNAVCPPFYPSQRQLRYLRNLPLEPVEYCQRWVKADPGKGYRKVCVNLLAGATGLSSRTVGNWGANFERRPRYILHVLRQVDLLNQIEELEQSGQANLSFDWLRE